MLRRISVVVVVLGALAGASAQQEGEFPTEESFWQRYETLSPTPKGEGHLGSIEPGKFIQFRYAVPRPRPAFYLVNVGNIVAMHGGGESYQVEVHLDSPDGPLLYKGEKIHDGRVFNSDTQTWRDVLWAGRR